MPIYLSKTSQPTIKNPDLLEQNFLPPFLGQENQDFFLRAFSLKYLFALLSEVDFPQCRRKKSQKKCFRRLAANVFIEVKLDADFFSYVRCTLKETKPREIS